MNVSVRPADAPNAAVSLLPNSGTCAITDSSTEVAPGCCRRSARRVVAESRIPCAAYESDEGMNHLDPLFAATAHNTATRTLAEFLARCSVRAAAARRDRH